MAHILYLYLPTYRYTSKINKRLERKQNLLRNGQKCKKLHSKSDAVDTEMITKMYAMKAISLH